MRACKFEVLKEVWRRMVVPSIMYGMDVMVWNESYINKLEVVENRVVRMALNVSLYAATEALRGDIGSPGENGLIKVSAKDVF